MERELRDFRDGFIGNLAESDQVANLNHHILGLLARETRYSGHLLGVVGEAGTGKSTMLNCLLEDPDLLKSGSSESITTVPTVLKYHCDHDSDYLVQLTFKTYAALEEEWKNMVYCAISEQNNDIEQHRPARALRVCASLQPIKEVLGAGLFGSFDWPSAITPLAAGEARSIVARLLQKLQSVQIRLSSESGRELDLLGMLTGDTQEHAETLTKRATTAALAATTSTILPRNFQHKLSHLLEKVTVFHKWDVLKTGVKLVDLPGVCAAAATWLWTTCQSATPSWSWATLKGL